MKEFEASETICIPKGWGDYLVPGGQRIGEVFVFHKPSEKDCHKIDVETVKILYIAKNKRLSLHMHFEKNEMFAVAAGQIKIEYILPDATKKEIILSAGERIFMPKHTAHRMTGLDNLNILLEASTVDSDQDSYRIEKGD